MKNRIKNIMFFINKCRYLKLKIVFSSIIKSMVYIFKIANFLLISLFIYNSFITKTINNNKMIYIGIIYISYLGFKFLDVYYSHYISYDVIEKLRTDIFKHYYTIFPGKVENVKDGDFVQMIINDINVFEWFIAHILTEWLSMIFVFILIFSIIISKSLIIGISLSFLLFISMKIIFTSFEEKENHGIYIKNKVGELVASITDGILGFKELLFFNREEDFFKEIEENSKKYNEVSNKYFYKELKDNLIFDLISLSFFFLMYILLIIKGYKITIYILLCICYYFHFRNCIYQTGNFGFIFGALNRLKKIYDITPSIKEYGNNKINICDIDKGIEFINSSFYYSKNPEKKILDNISFKVNKGEKTVLVSPSGGGKSTIFKLINRYYELSSGEIKIFGKNIKYYQEYTLRKNITSFNQNIFFFNDTLLENLRYSNKNLSETKIKELAEKLNIYDSILSKEKAFKNIINESASNYSGGEIQRLSLLRGLLKDSPILLMDEVSSELDEENEKILDNLLNEIKENKIILISAHKLSTIRRADKIIFFKNGKILGEGKYEELIEKNKFFNELLMNEEWRKDIEN